MMAIISKWRSVGSFAEFAIVAGLIGVQLIYGANTLFINRVLALGFSPLFLVVTISITTAAYLLPFAVFYERKKWPDRLNGVAVVYFVLIALVGTTVFQLFMVLGIKEVSPAIASAMSNLVPGFVFVIAACLRLEKVDIGCKYSRAKIMATLICLCGALSMSFLPHPSTSLSVKSRELDSTIEPHQYAAHRGWILGSSYLLAAGIGLSFSTVLQAVAMREFPAPFTLCVITSALGSIFTALVEIIIEGRLGVGSSNLCLESVIGIVLAGSTIAVVPAAYQTWCISKKGPVFVYMFNPIQTVFCAVLSAIVLGQIINLKSLSGMVLLFFGFYVFLWAKGKEDRSLVNVDGSVSTAPIADVEKPLLR